MEFVLVEQLNGAHAFADAVWKDELGKRSDFNFFGVPFRLMAPEHTADAPFRLDIPAGPWAEVALLFAVDEANPLAIQFATIRLTVGDVAGDVTLDLRSGDGPTCAPEIGRILRGPSGTLHYPVRFARLPLHPAAVAAAATGGPATIEFLSAAGRPSAFTIAALTLVKRTPLVELPDGFTLSCRVDLDGVKDAPLYEAEGALRIYVRDAKADPAPNEYDERYGNYFNFVLPDGSCPVLEAFLPGPAGRIGIPLGALEHLDGKHDLRIVWNGTYFTLDLDGHRDEDFPYVPLLWPKDDKGEVKSERITDFSFSFGAPKGPVAPPAGVTPQTGFHAMYWKPRGHNQWLGDVVTCEWDGRLHVFYLIDRRHHNSKGGRGGHWFEHLVTDDLVSWRELPPAVTMDVSTEYIGTGTPFRLGGKYCLAYGLHTTRHCDEAEIARRGLPFGGTYAMSDDGVHFTKSNLVFTPDQNPSVFNRPDGLLGMGCRDTLEKSPSIEGPWTTDVANAHVFGDCPCPFEWNGWHYIIQGFCTMARSPSGLNGTYTDEVLEGYDIYEGLSVPMVATWKDNRRFLLGWINHRWGWGGWLCMRELIQYPDGHLGTKWIPEVPMPIEPIVFEVRPNETLSLQFHTNDPKGADFAFILDAAAGKARFVEKTTDGSYPDVPTLSEMANANEAKYGAERIRAGRKYRPDEAGDFAIGNIRGLDSPFKVRVENYFDKKAGISLIDIEIAGQRTMVTRRFGWYGLAARPQESCGHRECRRCASNANDQLKH